MAIKNVISGFEKSSVWSHNDGGSTINPLRTLLFLEGDSDPKAKTPSLDRILSGFKSLLWRLLSKLDIEESGTANLSTIPGVHLTSKDVIRALKKMEEQRNEKRGQGAAANAKHEKYESDAVVRLLASLARGRAICRKNLPLTRKCRRRKCKK